jgi:YebC/PmpR family DNA-binding regulatory protein
LLLKAREANMPAENLDRAIKKGTGELPGIVYESMTYEAYGPGGVAFVVQVTTDNKVRAAKDLRSIFARHGGNLAASGAVMFNFLHAGQFLIPRHAITEDALTELALEAGADDIITTEDGYELRCAVHAFDRIAHALDDRKIKPAHAELAYIPTSTAPAPSGHFAKELAELHASLDALDDVQHIFSNEAD